MRPRRGSAARPGPAAGRLGIDERGSDAPGRQRGEQGRGAARRGRGAGAQRRAHWLAAPKRGHRAQAWRDGYLGSPWSPTGFWAVAREPGSRREPGRRGDGGPALSTGAAAFGARSSLAGLPGGPRSGEPLFTPLPGAVRDVTGKRLGQGTGGRMWGMCLLLTSSSPGRPLPLHPPGLYQSGGVSPLTPKAE